MHICPHCYQSHLPLPHQLSPICCLPHLPFPFPPSQSLWLLPAKTYTYPPHTSSSAATLTHTFSRSHSFPPMLAAFKHVHKLKPTNGHADGHRHTPLSSPCTKTHEITTNVCSDAHIHHYSMHTHSVHTEAAHLLGGGTHQPSHVHSPPKL